MRWIANCYIIQMGYCYFYGRPISKSVYFLNVIVGTFYQYHTFKTKIKIGKICNMKII